MVTGIAAETDTYTVQMLLNAGGDGIGRWLKSMYFYFRKSLVLIYETMSYIHQRYILLLQKIY